MPKRSLEKNSNDTIKPSAEGYKKVYTFPQGESKVLQYFQVTSKYRVSQKFCNNFK